MSFAHPLPVWALCLVVTAAALVAWHAYRRVRLPARQRYALTAFRLFVLLLLIVFLMRPVARRADADARDAVVPILVDVSRSMAIEDAGGRRIDRARELVQESLLPVLGSRFQVEVLGFAETVNAVEPAELTAHGRRSDLQAALADVRDRYRGRAVAGIVLVSDGGDTGSESAAPPGSGPPVFALGVGSDTIVNDREVLSVTAAEAVLDDSRVDLAVSAVSHGGSSEPIELRLLENGRPIEVRRVQPAGDGIPVREVFQVSPARGAPTVYTVEIPSRGGELVPENNSRSVLVQPPARSRRILLVEGAPGYEHSFLKRSWADDPGLEVDSVVRKGRNEQGRDTFYIQAVRSRSAALENGYPRRVEDLFRYDALVLANVEGHHLTRAQLEATRAFVALRGGGLLVLGARSFVQQGLIGTPLEEVLPLDLTDRTGGVSPASSLRGLNRLALTSHGELHPVMQLAPALEDSRRRWAEVPPLASIAPLGGPRPGAFVLATSNGPGGAPRALVAVQRFGEGRVLMFTGEAAWRWRMLLPAADRSYDTFWRQALRWLALPATDPLAVTAPAGAAPGENIGLSIAVRDASYQAQRDASVDVRVTRPDGRLEQLRGTLAQDLPASGAYVAHLRAEQSGVYRVTADAHAGDHPLGSASTAFLIGGADDEMSEPRLNQQVLHRVAAASGGRVMDPEGIHTLAEHLEAATPAAALAVRRDVWHSGWAFATVIALLGAEWILRRRWGLR